MIGTNNMLALFEGIKITKIIARDNIKYNIIKKDDVIEKINQIKSYKTNLLKSSINTSSKSAVSEKDKLMKSMTQELVNIRTVELPTELVGINGGMMKSIVDKLSADQKLVVDQCINLHSRESRNGFCE